MTTSTTTWQQERDEMVWSSHGIAALAATNWLDDTAREVLAVGGLWRAEGDRAVGRAVDADHPEIVLGAGESLRLGDLLLRGFVRDGAVAVRVLDPAAAARRGISRVERFPDDETACVLGRYEPDPTAARRESVDGHVSDTVYAGFVRFTVHGSDIGLRVSTVPDGLFAVFTDATSGSESYRFRFLGLPSPDADGTLTVDLNRAYLPPCAFSDHYVCPLPPAENRLSIPIRAGERTVV